MNLALFDFDGTITSADTFRPFIYFATNRRRVALGTLLLTPWIAAYRLGLLPTTRMRAAMAFVAFRGRQEREVNELGQSYARTLGQWVRPHALERIRWHQAQGDEVVVVSASLAPYLRAFCAEHGLALLCAELEAKSGVLSGRYVGGDCTGSEKARRVRAAYDLSRYPVVYAYGDTPEDRELLALAHEAYFCWERQPAAGRP
jgi:phosphatidylglycerophosphatase C